MTTARPTADDLGRVPLFAALPGAARQALADRFQVESFDAGHRLVTEGRPGYSFYVVAEGELAVQHDGEPVRTLGPGDHVGEIAILGPGRRTATVVTTGPVVVWSMVGTDFRLLQDERPDVAAALEDAMARRLAGDSAGGPPGAVADG